MLLHDIIHDIIWHVLQVYNGPGGASKRDLLDRPPLGKEVLVHA